jgi:Domain of unknown function (DUF4157)
MAFALLSRAPTKTVAPKTPATKVQHHDRRSSLGMNGSGQRLPDSTQHYFEPRLGHKFDHIRVHSDETAAEAARSLNARAFTLGNDVVFGAGQYQPYTTAGRRLLAHELVHTIQQERSAAHNAVSTIQRSIGFEFQTKNILTTNMGYMFRRKFPNKKGAEFFHKGKSGVELQSDTGSVVEFETAPFRKWSELAAQIQEAVDIARSLNETFGTKPSFAWNDEHRAAQKFKFSEQGSIEKLLRKGEVLQVNIKDPDFKAAIQSTEGFGLPQYESFMKEHEDVDSSDFVILSVENILERAAKQNKIKKGTDLSNLRGFLQVIVDYIMNAQESPSVKTKWSPVKARFGLMARTSFSSMFTLLSAEEKKIFADLVKSSAITSELDLEANAQMFEAGYWGHFQGMMALFRNGIVVALGDEENHKLVHDCASKTKTKGLDVSKCGAKVPESQITIAGWLDSVLKKEKDLLSPPFQGSTSMGKFQVRTKGEEKGLVIFETRSTRRERVQPLNQWLSYAEEVFLKASISRDRPGTGTELIYDGDNFNFGARTHEKKKKKKKQ